MFRYVDPSGAGNHSGCGCLTQISAGHKTAYCGPSEIDRVLTKEIYRDHDIPTDANKVKVIHLQHLAEWQKKLVERRSKIHRREIARLEALREKP